MAGIWSCFCAWNLSNWPWIKWLWNTVWEKCSSEHCKYCHFPVCKVHSSTMQWVCVSVQVCNRGRIPFYIRIRGTIKKFLTYTGTPLQSVPVWIMCKALLQSISSFGLRLGCHPFAIFQKRWDTSQIQTIHSSRLCEVHFKTIKLLQIPHPSEASALTRMENRAVGSGKPQV